MRTPGSICVAPLVAAVLALAALSPLPAAAQTAGIGRCTPCQPVDEARLAELRGGFELASGLQASFGIERAVYVNGRLVAEQGVHIADLSRLTAVQAQRLTEVLAGIAVLNDRHGLVVSAGAAAGPGLLIQNSLDRQTLRSLTVIDAGTNSLQLLRGTNAGASWLDALRQPLGPR